ncbi:MAG: DUF1295 domain-containing protein [Myxococcales bacterium]|nr:DUF1295 domain-containing protein [Myxococcales bacterium]
MTPLRTLAATHPVYVYSALFVFAFGACAFVVLQFVSAPYGRHQREGWGPVIGARLGWVLMEAPSPLCFLAFYVTGDQPLRAASLVLAAFYLVHYVYRAFIFPFRMRGAKKNKPVVTLLLAVVFNIFNGSLNGFALGSLAPHLSDTSWFADPRFIVGALLFWAGWYINHQSDAILRNLRAPGETGYKVPRGGLYRWVTSPNYFGEVLEWVGFALASWTWAGWAFAFFTFSNLAPRAKQHHQWYQQKFADYPPERRALIPWLW